MVPMLDHQPEEPLYCQLAGALRARMDTDEFPPGSTLPSETTLAVAYAVGRDVVRQALTVLHNESLVTMSGGRPALVREDRPKKIVWAPSGALVHTRMPTAEERTGLGMAEGVPLIIVTTDNGAYLHAADRVEVRVMGADETG